MCEGEADAGGLWPQSQESPETPKLEEPGVTFPQSPGRGPGLLTLDFRLLAPRTGRESISIALSLPPTPVCGCRYQKPHLGQPMFRVPNIHQLITTSARPVFPWSSREVFSTISLLTREKASCSIQRPHVSGARSPCCPGAAQPHTLAGQGGAKGVTPL